MRSARRPGWLSRQAQGPTITAIDGTVEANASLTESIVTMERAERTSAAFLLGGMAVVTRGGRTTEEPIAVTGSSICADASSTGTSMHWPSLPPLRASIASRVNSTERATGSSVGSIGAATEPSGISTDAPTGGAIVGEGTGETTVSIDIAGTRTAAAAATRASVARLTPLGLERR